MHSAKREFAVRPFLEEAFPDSSGLFDLGHQGSSAPKLS